MSPMSPMNNDVEFSKARIELLCDGILAIAMTLLVLELKVPELLRAATSAKILHQFMLASLLAIQWKVAERQGLLSKPDDPRRHRFGIVMSLQPVSFAIALLLVYLLPRQSMASVAITQAIIAAFSMRQAKAVAARAHGLPRDRYRRRIVSRARSRPLPHQPASRTGTRRRGDSPAAVGGSALRLTRTACGRRSVDAPAARPRARWRPDRLGEDDD